MLPGHGPFSAAAVEKKNQKKATETRAGARRGQEAPPAGAPEPARACGLAGEAGERAPRGSAEAPLRRAGRGRRRRKRGRPERGGDV